MLQMNCALVNKLFNRALGDRGEPHQSIFWFCLSHLPEGDEVLEGGDADEDAVQKAVAEKQHEELVVLKGNTVVDPRTVVVHLGHALATHAAVVRPVGLDVVALFAVARGCRTKKYALSAIQNKRSSGNYLHSRSSCWRAGFWKSCPAADALCPPNQPDSVYQKVIVGA